MKLTITLLILLGFTSISYATTPTSPSNIGITYIDDSTVRVSFVDHSDNEWGFHLYIDGSKEYIPRNDVRSKYVYKTLTRLSCNQTHTVSIDAYNSEGKRLAVSKDFSFEDTLGKDCLPVIQINTQNLITLTTKDLLLNQNPNIDPFVSNFGELESCSWKLNNQAYHGASCEDIKQGRGFQLSYLNSLNIGDNELTLTVTDINGVNKTDTLSIKLVDNSSDTIYLSTANRTMKVGQTILIQASIERILTLDRYSVSSHSWGDSKALGTFDSSMFDTGHVYAGQGYTTSTAYTAESEGNTTLTLYGNGGSKSINVEIIAPNRLVIDDKLMWQDNHEEIRKPWSLDSLSPHDTDGDTAETYCTNLNWANYSDWRIPKIEELIAYIGFNNDNEYWGLIKYDYYYSKFGTITSSSLNSLAGDEELLVKCVRDIK